MADCDAWPPVTLTGHLDLSDRVRLRLSGPDAPRYLNGQVTNDVRRAVPGAAMRAAVCNAKGKMEAEVFLHTREADAGTLWIDGPADLRDFLPLRLEKYLIADDAVLEDVSDATSLLHFFGASPPALPEHPDVRCIRANRAGQPGWDVWCRADQAAGISGLSSAAAPALVEWVRIIHRVPLWGAELGPDVLPPEARMEEDAIDYHKGCYIGQETISRLRSVGQVTRRLELLIPSSGPPPAPGTLILTGPESSKCGQITSSAAHPVTGASAALGWVKRLAAESRGALFLAEEPHRELRLAAPEAASSR